MRSLDVVFEVGEIECFLAILTDIQLCRGPFSLPWMIQLADSQVVVTLGDGAEVIAVAAPFDAILLMPCHNCISTPLSTDRALLCFLLFCCRFCGWGCLSCLLLS